MAVLTTLRKGHYREITVCSSYRFLSLFRMRDINLDSQRRRDVGEFCGGKNWEMCGMLPQMWGISYGVSSTTSYMVCPECGARLVVCVKKGKVSVFDDTRSEEKLAKKRHARLTRYAAKINEIVR